MTSFRLVSRAARALITAEAVTSTAPWIAAGKQACRPPSQGVCSGGGPSGPIPTFATARIKVQSECRNQKDH